MCGFTGIFNTDRKPVSRPLLKKMTDMIAHRGPDGEGYWVDTFVGLGHRRLAILDLSPAGHQPMISIDGRYIISYNGEIYNFRNIRIELEALGYRFHSQTDTEVVLKAFQEWGKEAVKKFNGMFAFAIWDEKEKRLTLVRDRYGIKPLYYYYDGKKIVFGSEIKSIIQHPEVKVDVSIPALNEYFSFQNVFSDLTLFKNIKLLPAGSLLEIGLENRLVMDKYWDFNFKEDHSYKNEKEVVEELTYLFEQAVNRQLVSDVEVGSYLSGGMDSGAITGIAAGNFKDLKTFTCGFDLSEVAAYEFSFDERAKAEYLSNLFKTEHYEVVLKAGDMERIIEDLVWHLEDPRVGQSYPNYYISRLASKFVKVSLSGTGGDELFAGYPWRYYQAVVNDDFEDYSDKYYKYWQRLIPDSFKPKFYHPDIYPQIWDYQTKDVFKNVLKGVFGSKLSPEEYVNRSLYFESKTFLHGLLLVEDKISMAHGLETRLPFLDNDLVDFAMKLPIKFKLQNLGKIVRLDENEPGPKTRKYFTKTKDGKTALRKMFKQFVPTKYTNGIKQGFSAPDASWFKGQSATYIKDVLYTPKARIYDYIGYDFATGLLDEHFSGDQNRRLLIWSMLNFEKWLKIYK